MDLQSWSSQNIRGMHLAESDEELARGRSRPVTMRVQHASFDPGERIPSYESSQEQHQRLLSVQDPGAAPAADDAEAAVVSGVTQMSSLLSPFSPLRLLLGALHLLLQVLLSLSLLQRIAPSLPSPALSSRSRAAAAPALSRIREREAAPSPPRHEKRSLKRLGLKFLNARQHFLLAACRDISLVPCILGLCQSWWFVFRSWHSSHPLSTAITAARVSEHFFTGVWCIVAGILLYSVLDGLMVRWIVSYTTTGSIVRMATMSAIIVVIEECLLAALSAEGYNYGLHSWILISCALTVLYIGQNFVTSNIDLRGRNRPRFFDVYNIVVFAVVPVGLASFITMIGLLRSLLILRLDIDQITQTGIDT